MIGLKVRTLTVVGTLAALGLATPARADTVLTIGNLLELTGPMSASGPAMAKANQLAVDLANKAAAEAGVGLTVKAVSVDVQGDPQAALSAARSLVEKGASCMIGPATTPESLAIAKGLTIRRKITLWPTATSTRLRTGDDEGTIFRTVPPDDKQALALAQAIDQAVGGASGKTVSIGYRNEPYGEGLAKNFTAAWQALVGKVRGPTVYDPNQASFDTEAGQIVAGDPAGYLVIDYPDSFVKMGAALLRTGSFDPKKLFVPDALAFTEVPSNIPPESLEGARGVRAGTPTSSERYKKFDELWQGAGGTEHYSLDVNEFDASLMCVLAAVAAKSSDPAAMQAQFRKISGAPGDKYDFTQLAAAMKALAAGQDIDFDGVSGPLDLAANGDPTTSLYDLFDYEKGRLVVLRQIDAKQ